MQLLDGIIWIVRLFFNGHRKHREKSEQMAKGKKPIHSHDKWLDSVNNNERHDMQRNKNTNLQQYNK